MLFLITTMSSFSQSEFQIEVGLGYAFQSEMMLNNESLENTSAFGLRFGGNYLKMLNNKFYIETGLYGKYNRGRKTIETLDFISNSLKVQLPLYAGYKVSDKWKFSIGASIENNKDFDNLNFKREDNLRYDLLTKLVYIFNNKTQISYYTNWILNDTPDVYTISSPKSGMYLGVILPIWKSKKQKNIKL